MIIEVHNDPPHALSDGAQSLTPAQFDKLSARHSAGGAVVRQNRFQAGVSMEKKTVAIVGLGLIGGSMALALRRRTAHRLVGIDVNPAVCEAALQQDAVDEAGGPERLAEADIVLLALAPQHLIPFVQQHIDRIPAGAIVSDVCGVKAAIVEVCEPLCEQHGLFFVGGHPMAGKEHSGFGNADADLFVGASYIFAPTPRTDRRALETMQQLAHEMGCARTTLTTPQEHDRIIAFTSQVPACAGGGVCHIAHLPAIPWLFGGQLPGCIPRGDGG